MNMLRTIGLVGARLSQCAAATMIAFAGAGAQSRAGMTDTSAPAQVADSSAFAAIVQAIVADTGLFMYSKTSIDPRPLDLERLGPSGEEALIPMIPAALRARESTIRAHGLPIGDARRPIQCAGVMIPNSPKTYHKGCPSRGRSVFSIGVPRVANASELPGTEATDGPRWTSEVVQAHIGPEGVSYLVSNYMLVRSDLGWKAIKGALVKWFE